jgi:hypothetical protein
LAKRFLDTLDDAFEDGALADLIPGKASTPTRKKPPVPRKKGPRSRKKSFLSTLDNAQSPKTKSRGGGGKSFLGALEEVFDEMNEKELDSLFPSPGTRNRKPANVQQQEATITTAIDKQLLAAIRKIAREHQVPIKDVIQEALRLWIDRK